LGLELFAALTRGREPQMIAKEVDSYIRRLQNKERELVSAIAKYETDGRESKDSETQDFMDRANHTYTKETLFQKSDSNRATLGLVQAALERAEDGSFGLCIECGRLVERKRLDAVPWARHCIKCQKLQDEGQL